MPIIGVRATMAEHPVISARTVETHVCPVLRELSCPARHELTRRADRRPL